MSRELVPTSVNQCSQASEFRAMVLSIRPIHTPGGSIFEVRWICMCRNAISLLLGFGLLLPRHDISCVSTIAVLYYRFYKREAQKSTRIWKILTFQISYLVKRRWKKSSQKICNYTVFPSIEEWRLFLLCFLMYYVNWYSYYERHRAMVCTLQTMPRVCLSYAWISLHSCDAHFNRCR